MHLWVTAKTKVWPSDKKCSINKHSYLCFGVRKLRIVGLWIIDNMVRYCFILMFLVAISLVYIFRSVYIYTAALIWYAIDCCCKAQSKCTCQVTHNPPVLCFMTYAGEVAESCAAKQRHCACVAAPAASATVCHQAGRAHAVQAGGARQAASSGAAADTRQVPAHSATHLHRWGVQERGDC